MLCPSPFPFGTPILLLLIVPASNIPLPERHTPIIASRPTAPPSPPTYPDPNQSQSLRAPAL
ncbi:uncharacterized protein PODANS_1_10870 [Podospora anserina S mat+]|uniref:Podospora anserina S mat+ genomic DNA chromosome 1, supercontig 2 n=1 Tax=Podospora anserina (strain S / ATCC MYA-4624 / DSM 980 / FGSC 10383) TaxID=515849 RepID=B2AYE9_PODAN|nr:uncharacterized protein PODANS_1_10870 [Podospora anserina S mat+]CAP69423.1 unnamed protein product [Podospora anserina S mat+]CDP23447.1 Putative protein of unknown function [Podospora anserina S mat+]